MTPLLHSWCALSLRAILTARSTCKLARMRHVVMLSLCLLIGASAACSKGGAPQARALIRKQHAPRVRALTNDMLERHERGLQAAADRVAAGFVKAEPAEQEQEMRQVLKLLRSPKRGVPELVISPMSFIAVVGKDGHCIARDLEPDPMKGMDLASDFPVVADALKGKAGMGIGEFKSAGDGQPSVTIIMAAPAHYRGQVVGSLVLGIPLWRLQQVLTKQLQGELAGKEQVIVWVYVYRGDDLHKHGTPPDLDKLVPDGKARASGLAKSPGGYTGEVAQFSYWYGYGVQPLKMVAPDIGAVIFRMEPR